MAVFLSASMRRGQRGEPKCGVMWGSSPFIPPQPPLRLSSEHPLPALNLRSRHTLRSGKGAPLVGRGRWREQDVILSLARLQRQAGTGEGGEELRGQRGCEPLDQPSCWPAHLVHSCSRRREPRESRGMEKAVWGEPFTPKPSKFGVQVSGWADLSCVMKDTERFGAGMMV